MVLSYRSHRAPLLDPRTPFSFTRSPVAAQKFELLRLEYKCFLPFFFDQLPYFYWSHIKLYLESVFFLPFFFDQLPFLLKVSKAVLRICYIIYRLFAKWNLCQNSVHTKLLYNDGMLNDFSCLYLKKGN